mmetsp:Transcript_15020/g.35897  ORF Transcript_15020/g.35897 Transcript_15020/m.35897 type:complete len:225 (+) Transcript_15020:127-801(+)
MGNVPLPSPPKETASKALCHIVTRRTTGTLQLLPSVDVCADQLSILGRTDDDVKSKIFSLEDRIKRCRAGRFNWAVGILALVFVAAFVAGLFFKWFWQSFLFDNPLYLIIIVIIELMLGFSANYMEKRETAALIFDIENTIFEEWYEDPNAVRISIQKVYGTFPTTFRGHQTGSSKRRCCTGSPNTRQGTFISITFQREDDSESITGISRTMDTYTHRSDQLHA